MSWYPRTKLMFHSLRRNVNPNILSPSHHVSYSIKLTRSSKFSSTSSRELGLRSHVSNNINPTGSSKLFWFSSIFSRELGLRSHVPYSINLAGSSKFPCFSSISFCELGLRSHGQKTKRSVYKPKRFYCADRSQVRDFKSRGPRRWFQNPKTLYFGNLETVPYTKRTHLVLLPETVEKLIGETQFEKFKEKEKEKILPENHPESIRVQMITKKIVDALKRGAPSSHIEGINWEVLVVKEPTARAFCMPGGKIVVHTGLLDKFKSDVEVATVIGHEVGHVVARHHAEHMTDNLFFAIPQLLLYKLYMPRVVGLIVNKITSLFFKLPFSRRREKEADYIGLLLIASAGYDPRVAPKVYEKLRERKGLEKYLSTHPSGKERSQLLAQANVMEEALVIYREVHSRRCSGLRGLLLRIGSRIFMFSG